MCYLSTKKRYYFEEFSLVTLANFLKNGGEGGWDGGKKEIWGVARNVVRRAIRRFAG